jgi:hypothetical protein
MMPIVVTYWTDDRYKALADRMLASAEAVGLETKGYFRENPTGTWQAGDCAKPEMVLKAVDDSPDRDVLFVDADCRFISHPVLLDSVTHDYDMACYHESYDLPTSTVLWLRAKTGRRYAARWLDEMKKTPNTPNDKGALRRTVMAERPKSVFHLPPAYCWTEQWLRGRFGAAVPVIEHFAVGAHEFPTFQWEKSKHSLFK